MILINSIMKHLAILYETAKRQKNNLMRCKFNTDFLIF